VHFVPGGVHRSPQVLHLLQFVFGLLFKQRIFLLLVTILLLMTEEQGGPTLVQCSTEFGGLATSTSAPALPPTSPARGYSHLISQNSMFTAPPGSRFILAPNANLSVTVFLARNLDIEAKGNAYVRALQGDYKYMTASARLDHPVWNETFKFPVLSPVRELMILELWDDKVFGKSLIGYVPLDLSLLPSGTEVDTWEKLCNSPRGEISIGLTANGFGLECLPQEYDRHYEDWRKTIPSVTKESPIYSKRQNTTNLDEPPGPYAGKSVPAGYVVDNGYVKRSPSTMTKALGKAKGLLGIAAR